MGENGPGKVLYVSFSTREPFGILKSTCRKFWIIFSHRKVEFTGNARDNEAYAYDQNFLLLGRENYVTESQNQTKIHRAASRVKGEF